MHKPRALSIFTGIGGFDIACVRAGFEVVGQVEIDPRCYAFLQCAWPTVKKLRDIKDVKGNEFGPIELLCGGPPCQPASRAGEQRGQKDDRWLWDEALRVLEEAEPDSVVFENPPGILDVGIDGILSEMGRIGYETQPFDIPACAVGSPQLRHRIWIVGFLVDSISQRRRRRRLETRPQDARNATTPVEGGNAGQGDVGDTMCEPSPGHTRAISGTQEESSQEGQSNRHINHRPVDASQGHMADPQCSQWWENPERSRRNCEGKHSEGQAAGGHQGSAETGQWDKYIWLPCADGKVRRAPDDSIQLVDGLHRSLLGAVGNSIVPQVAYQIIRAIYEQITLAKC